MRSWTKASGLIFLAAASVYSGQVIGATPAKSAKQPADNKNTDVKLLEDQADPFASAPTTKPADATTASTATTTSKAVSITPSSPSAVLPAMNANPDGTFSLNITNGADLVETLRVIGFQAQKSILPSKDVRAALPALDLYNVTVHEALDAILKVNGFVYKEEGNFIYIYTVKEAQEIEKANRVTNTEVFRVYYVPVADVLNMIKPILSAEAGQVAVTKPAVSGLDSGTKDVGGDSHASNDILVVTDYPENLDKVRKLLKEIDHRPQQILIEATILRAALTDDNALGIDFNVVGGVDFSSLTSTNGQITNGQTQTGARNFGDQVHSAGTGNAFSSGIANGLKLGFISNNVSVFVSALEGITDTTVLANPKVLALNKQKGEVIVGRKDGYLTTTVTESSTVQTVDFLDTGTRLIFRPFIGDDGYIRMEIHPEDSSGGLTSANLPFKITTEVTSNIMVKDGRTIVIGGLFRESSDSSRSQIPGLGNLPLVGPLFRQQRDRTTREEIIILLTPHIIKDDSAYADASEDMLKQAEQLRVGVRKGMMWFGRERLAESCYDCAVAEMAKAEPDKGKALWHLDCALNLNPKFLEAIQLKQQLTGEEISEVDNSAIRGFVKRQILAERAKGSTKTSSTTGTDADAVVAEGAPATLPSTQPAVVTFTFAPSTPSTQPSTQPSETASAAQSGNVEAALTSVIKDMTFTPTSATPTTAPTSQPSTTEEQPKTTVTELPMEETTVEPSAPAPSGGDQNK